VTRVSSFLIPLGCLSEALRHGLPISVQIAEAALGVRVAPLCCFAKPLGRLGVVL
jgi:hypothetical protein